MITQVDKEVSFNFSMSNSANSSLNQEETLPDDETLSLSQSQSQSLFSTPITKTSATERKDKVLDRFNGILYHVIPSEDRITILFSSKDLYSKFIDSINTELQPRVLNDTRSSYITHIKGRWCSLISDKNAASLSATGPGHMLWRDIIFSRLALRLYQQYATETDEDINRVQMSQTSTPTMTGQMHLSPPVSPVITPEAQINAQHISEISFQIAELHQISKSLQDQLCCVSTKLETLLQRSQEMSRSPSAHELSDTTVKDDGSQSLTLSSTSQEVEPLPNPKPATYSAALMRDHKNKSGQDKQKNAQNKRVKSGQLSGQNNQDKQQKQSTFQNNERKQKKNTDNWRLYTIRSKEQRIDKKC